MQFGLSFLPDSAPETKSGQEYFSDVLALCMLADEGQLDTVKITEHYLHPYGGYCPNPLTFLAAIAMKTRRLRLMTGGIVASFHHPIQLASEIAMVDNLSGGRLDVGFVRGYMPYEFDALGVPMDESRPRYEETIKAVDQLLTKSEVSITTPFFSFENATILPRPVQSPRPPIWCAANTSSQSFVWAGQQKYDLLCIFSFQPMTTLQENVRLYRNENPSGKVTIFIPLVMDESHAKAIELGSHYLDRYHKVWAAAAQNWSGRQSTQYPMYDEFPRLLKSANYTYMNGIGSVFFGDPLYVREKIAWLTSQIHPDQILWNLDIGAMPLDVSRKTLELFINKVQPEFSMAQT